MAPVRFLFIIRGGIPLGYENVSFRQTVFSCNRWCGLFGSNLVEALLKKIYVVRVLDNLSQGARKY